MERKLEWIAAEQALTESCQKAVDSGLTMVWDRYGIKWLCQEVPYEIDEDKAVCAIGSYLIGKQAIKGIMLHKVAGRHLNVSSSWVSGLEHSFGDFDKDDPSTRFYKDDLAGWEDGYEAGLRLREKFLPQRYHYDV